MTILSKVDSKADSNILAICDNIFNRTYAVGFINEVANSIHKKTPTVKELKKGKLDKLKKNGNRRITRQTPVSEKSISFKSLINILKSKYNFLETPLLKSSNETLRSVLNIIIKDYNWKISDEVSNKRIENTLKASVINPINRKEYGNNAESTIKIKGFDKPIVDTGQIINNIEAWRIE